MEVASFPDQEIEAAKPICTATITTKAKKHQYDFKILSSITPVSL